MHERDTDNWREITEGLRSVTWSDFVGSAEGAIYLSGAGRGLLPKMVEGFDSWFGEDWLRQALRPDGQGRIPWLGRFSPTLTIVGAEHGVAGAFLELVRWWAAFETQKREPGIGRVKADSRRDVSITRLLHTLTQLRLGAIARQAGMGVIYEPSPGDLRLTHGTHSVTVEVFAMRTARDVDEKTRSSDASFELMRGIERQHGVHFHGDLPELCSDTDDWVQRVRKTAAEARRLGIALTMRWGEHEPHVEPGGASPGTMLSGPSIEHDVGTRLRQRVSLKARQIEKASSGWLWLENHGAIDMLVPVHALPLADQLGAYTTLLEGATEGVACVKGVTVSAAGQRQWPPALPAHEVVGSREATRQSLPLDRVRTTFHLPSEEGPESRLMRLLTKHEPHWLDSALSQLGVADSALELISPDLR